LNRLAKQFLSTIIAITAAVTSIVIQTPNANANEVRTISKNGISLNANPTYGYKHGAMKVSQYFTSNYVDNEQRWEIIPIGSDKSILRNIEYNKCLNSYQTQVGSTPNLYQCDGNDSDQQVIVNGDSIIHVYSGLELNLGDRNDTPVVWKKAQAKNFKSAIQSYQVDEKVNSQPENKSWFNFCPEISRNEFKGSNGTFKIMHLNSCGKSYTYMNRQALYELQGESRNSAIVSGSGTIASLFDVIGLPATPFTTYLTVSYALVSSDAQTCLERGGTSAWFIEYGGPVGHNIECNVPN
jgi:hypothetical protein